MAGKEEDTKQRITKKSMELFKQYGIRYVTMDMIAEQLGMSKKTLYVHFNNKKDLIFTSIEDHLTRRKQVMAKLFSETSSVVEGMLVIMNKTIEDIKEQNPVMVEELQRYYPKIAETIEERQQKEDYQELYRLIEQGKKENVFREEVNSDITAKLFLVQFRYLVDEDLFPRDQYPRSELFFHIFINFLRGIATPHGQAIIDQFGEETK